MHMWLQLKAVFQRIVTAGRRVTRPCACGSDLASGLCFYFFRVASFSLDIETLAKWSQVQNIKCMWGHRALLRFCLQSFIWLEAEAIIGLVLCCSHFSLLGQIGISQSLQLRFVVHILHKAIPSAAFAAHSCDFLLHKHSRYAVPAHACPVLWFLIKN